MRAEGPTDASTAPAVCFLELESVLDATLLDIVFSAVNVKRLQLAFTQTASPLNVDIAQHLTATAHLNVLLAVPQAIATLLIQAIIRLDACCLPSER